MKIELKKANAKNVDFANKFLTMLIKDEQQYDENIKDSFEVESYYENLYNDNYLYFAYADEKIVGYLYGFIIEDELNIKKSAKLDALFILPEYRNMKLASLLIDNFKNWCQENNAKIIMVNVWSNNLTAKHLYLKHDFIPKKEELFIGYSPKQYQKLVRDKIPEIISSNNETPVTRILSDLEYKEELEKKLYEEYLEVLTSTGKNRIEELADMLEVMISLAKLENKSLDDIITVAKKKNEKRGSFEDKIYLETVK